MVGGCFFRSRFHLILKDFCKKTGPKLGQKLIKIDVNIEKRFFEKTWFFLKKKHIFSKNRFSMLKSIFYQFLIQLGSLFLAKILQNQMKTRSKKASKNCQVFESIWAPFWGGKRLHFSCAFRAFFDGFALESGSVRFQVLNFPRNILQKRQ